MWLLSQDRFGDLLGELPVVFYADSHEPIPRTLYLSSNASTVLGTNADAHLDDPDLWYRSIHPDDRTGLMDAWGTAFETGEPYVFDYRYQRPDGATVRLREHAAPVRDAGGGILHWQGVLLDVTDTHESQAELARAAARYRALVERLPAVIYQDTDETPSASVYVSPNASQILGVAPETLIETGGAWVRHIHPEDLPSFEVAWEEAVRNGSTFSRLYRWVRPDGSTIWVHDHSWPTGSGRERVWHGVLLDVTAQREAELAHEASEARYRALIENVPAVVYEMEDDDERRTVFVSPRIETLLGYTREEWLSQPDIWTELLHPDDRETELAAHDELSASGEPWSREYRLIAADGREIWVRDQAALVRTASDEPLVWQGILIDITAQKEAESALQTANDELELRVLQRTHDLEVGNELMQLEITERRRAERDLRDAEERARLLVEDLPAAAYRWQVRATTPDDWTEMYVSPAIERLLGFSVDEWNTTESLWQQRLHPHDRDRVGLAVAHSVRTGEPYEVEARYLAKDGRVVWVLDRATLLRRNQAGEPYVFQGVMIDITERKEAELKAGEAESRFRSIVEDGPDVAYAYRLRSWDPPEMTIEYVSPQLGPILGYRELLWVDEPERWMEMLHPDDVARVGEITADCWAKGTPWDHEYRMIRADGSIVWLHDRGRCVARDEDGRPVRFLGAINEASQRVETAIRDRRALDVYRALVDQIPAVVWSEEVGADGRSRPTFISDNVHEMVGYTPQELLAEPHVFARMLHSDDRARVQRKMRAMDAGPADSWEDEFRVLDRNGVVRWLWARARRSTPIGVTPATWQGVTIDVTDRHAAAESEAVEERTSS